MDLSLLVPEHLLLLQLLPKKFFLLFSTHGAGKTGQLLEVVDFEPVPSLFALDRDVFLVRRRNHLKPYRLTRLLDLLPESEAFGAPRVWDILFGQLVDCVAAQEEIVLVDAGEAHGGLPVRDRQRAPRNQSGA